MIRRYTRDLLRAVDVLHDRGIIHRDIKGVWSEGGEVTGVPNRGPPQGGVGIYNTGGFSPGGLEIAILGCVRGP